MPLSSLASATPTQAGTSVRPPPSLLRWWLIIKGEMIELPAEIFAKPMRKDILHRCVVWYLANLRQVSALPYYSSLHEMGRDVGLMNRDHNP
ncbi:MAG: 50S ribosomal protein L4, partial [Sphingobacteriales bacterium]